MTQASIDLAAFRELQETAGADFVKELVGTFLEEAPGMLADLRGATIPATGLYERHGMAWPAVVAALLGCGAVAVMGWLGRPAGTPPYPPLA